MGTNSNVLFVVFIIVYHVNGLHHIAQHQVHVTVIGLGLLSVSYVPECPKYSVVADTHM